jgi:hypothetical protein
MKEVVVVNFKSPPFIGIGGRRWGKLTHFFLEQNIKVHLVYANWGNQSHLRALDWLQHEMLLPYKINPRKWASYDRLNILEKLLFKWKAVKARWFGEYSIFDEGRWCITDVHKTLNDIVAKNRIDAIFVTGPPFSWVSAVSDWNRATQLPLWVDIRDPWLLANNWGMPDLSNIQRRREEERYRNMFANARWVSSPTISLLDETHLEEQGQKKVHLKHFFDWEDWKGCEGIPIESDLVVYSGQFYWGMDVYMNLWKSIVIEKSGLRWEIYSKDWEKFELFFKDIPHVNIFPDQGPSVFKRIAACSALVLCLADYNKDFFTTKYFDYLPAQKPILYIGPEGKVAAALMENKQNAMNSWFQKDNYFESNGVFEMPKASQKTKLDQEERQARGNCILELLKYD